MLGQAAPVAGHLDPAAGDDDAVEVDADLDASADEAGVDRVVVGVDADVVVPGQAGGEAHGGVGQHRREARRIAPRSS